MNKIEALSGFVCPIKEFGGFMPFLILQLNAYKSLQSNIVSFQERTVSKTKNSAEISWCWHVNCKKCVTQLVLCCINYDNFIFRIKTAATMTVSTLDLLIMISNDSNALKILLIKYFRLNCCERILYLKYLPYTTLQYLKHNNIISQLTCKT